MSNIYQFTLDIPPSPSSLNPTVMFFKLTNLKCIIPFTITYIVYCLCRKLHLPGRDTAKCLTHHFLCQPGPQLRLIWWLSASQCNVGGSHDHHFQDWPSYDPPYSTCPFAS